jgi:sugar/nucleoside kinase (ribokinase family)
MFHFGKCWNHKSRKVTAAGHETSFMSIAGTSDSSFELIHAIAAARWRCAQCLAAIAWRAVANTIWRIPSYDGKFVQDPKRNGGGFGVIACRQAIKLGMRASLFTAVGDDASGTALRLELAGTGAATKTVRVLPSPTTQADVVVYDCHRAVLIDRRRSGADWRPDVSDWRLLRHADVICLGGSLRDDVVAETCDRLRRLNKPAFANLTRLEQPKNHDLRGIRILQVSQGDARNFGVSNGSPSSLADVLLERGPDIVVVTASEHGARAFDQGGHCVRMPAVPVPQKNTLSPTGSGDAHFMAAVAGFLAGLSTEDWMNLASLAGGFLVEHGHVGSWFELLRLAKAWPPAKRLDNRD